MKTKFIILLIIFFVYLSNIAYGVLTDGLISYWSFDSDATDEIGSHDLTVQSSPSLVSCKIDDCYSFDGTDDYLSGASDVDYNDVRTFAFWSYLDSSQSGTMKVIVGKGTEYFSTIIWRPDIGDVFHYQGGITQTSTFLHESPDITGAWFHTIITYYPSYVTLFINNVLHTNTTTVGTDPWMTIFNHTFAQTDFTVGGTGEGGYYLKGKVDEIGLWDRMITQTERADLYNSGAGYHPVIPLSAPIITNSSYNMTSDGGDVGWRYTPRVITNTTDGTPTFTFDTDIAANCSAQLIADVYTPGYKIATTGGTTHIATMFSNQSLSYGTNNIYVACQNNVGEVNSSALPINMTAGTPGAGAGLISCIGVIGAGCGVTIADNCAAIIQT